MGALTCRRPQCVTKEISFLLLDCFCEARSRATSRRDGGFVRSGNEFNGINIYPDRVCDVCEPVDGA